ncbi:Mobile element protein [Lactiplantibacillus plantarum]|nr:Mobile element protein [Lactiplantibacillus plantarum]KZU89313.1 Mobile element protein [Lactiplantibacillus plantarum]
MKNYPSNITRQQFELIRPALENFRKRTKPRKYNLGMTRNCGSITD